MDILLHLSLSQNYLLKVTMKKIIVLGGPPTVGKSSIAKKISRKYNIPWMPTDLIREWMSKIVREEDYPNLFLDFKYTAESFWTKFDIEEAMQQELKRDKNVFKGIKSFIEENFYWGCYILEGISIHPSMVYELKNIKHTEFLFFYLIESSLKRIRETIYERGLWGPANTYPDWIKEKEVKYVEKFNQWYLDECTKNNVEYTMVGADYRKVFKEISHDIDDFIQ